MMDPRSIPALAVIATKPVIILGNGPQIDRLQASFWDRLNAIQLQSDSEVIVAGVNRIGIAEACLKNRYKPDILATVDKPFFRTKTSKDVSAEQMSRNIERARKLKEMAPLKVSHPKIYEDWEADQNRLMDLETRAEVERNGGKAEQVPTDTTAAFARSFQAAAGVSRRVVSQQAVWFLQPSPMPNDIVLNLDTSMTGPPDRAKMQFTTSDWLVNWFARIGVTRFYFYGMSMREGAHCKTHGLVEDDDYSWTEPKRQATCFKTWDIMREHFPGIQLFNCDRKSLFVEKRVMEYGTPEQLDLNYKLMPDAECNAKRDAIMNLAASVLLPQIKKVNEDAEIARLKAQMAADAAKVVA
jgi:hypothetical protein